MPIHAPHFVHDPLLDVSPPSPRAGSLGRRFRSSSRTSSPDRVTPSITKRKDEWDFEHRGASLRPTGLDRLPPRFCGLPPSLRLRRNHGRLPAPGDRGQRGRPRRKRACRPEQPVRLRHDRLRLQQPRPRPLVRLGHEVDGRASRSLFRDFSANTTGFRVPRVVRNPCGLVPAGPHGLRTTRGTPAESNRLYFGSL